MEKAKFDEIVRNTSSFDFLNTMIDSDKKAMEWMQSGDVRLRALAMAIKQKQVEIYGAIKARETKQQPE